MSGMVIPNKLRISLIKPNDHRNNSKIYVPALSKKLLDFCRRNWTVSYIHAGPGSTDRRTGCLEQIQWRDSLR